MRAKCQIEDCDTTSTTKGYCGRHYKRLVRYGDPLYVKRSPRYATAEDAFVARAKRVGECLIWTGSKSGKGYGAISDNGQTYLAHRWAYERARGPIPKEMHVDHICHNPACVEVSHLRLASRFDNARYLKGARRDSRTGVRGLGVLDGGIWEARVFTHGKKIRKTFRPDEKEKAMAWLIETREAMFGQFAGLPGDPTASEAVGNIDRDRKKGNR